MKKEAKKPSRMKHMILMLAIALVFVFFVGYLVQTIFPAPMYGDYCKNRPTVDPDSKETCEAIDGKWNEFGGAKPVRVEEGLTGWCDVDHACRQEYDAAREKYENVLFYFNIVLGLAAVIVSFFLSVETVSSGFMAGGVINLIYGSIRNWENLPDIFRTILLGVALAVLVWIGYKKLK